MFLEHQNHIRMISEGSCNSENWKFSSAMTGINYTLKYITIERVILNSNIAQYYFLFSKTPTHKKNTLQSPVCMCVHLRD